MVEKQSNLAVAADVATVEQMLTLADQVIMSLSHCSNIASYNSVSMLYHTILYQYCIIDQCINSVSI